MELTTGIKRGMDLPISFDFRRALKHRPLRVSRSLLSGYWLVSIYGGPFRVRCRSLVTTMTNHQTVVSLIGASTRLFTQSLAI